MAIVEKIEMYAAIIAISALLRIGTKYTICTTYYPSFLVMFLNIN